MLASVLPDLVLVGPFPRPDELASDSLRLLPERDSAGIWAVGEVARGTWEDDVDDRRRDPPCRMEDGGRGADSPVGDIVREVVSTDLPLPFDFGLEIVFSGSSSTSMAVSCKVLPGAVLMDFLLPADLADVEVLKKRALSDPTTNTPSAIADLTGIMSWLSASNSVIPDEGENDGTGLSNVPGS